MLRLHRIEQVRKWRKPQKGSVGLVPTMGFLHEGHLSLVREARTANDAVIVSIFVNPTQFGQNEDLTTYPRDIERDLELLKDEGVDAVFAPSVEEMYHERFSTSIAVGAVAQPLEGATRPGHFEGVATVVAKLLNIVSPARAYFGQKDAQQLAVIRRMSKDLNFDVEIVACPTVRDSDGLAMSSRNAYLNSDERKIATVLFKALTAAKAAFDAGDTSADSLKERMRAVLAVQDSARVDYVSVADPDTMAELELARDGALVSLAVRIGRARLIDNLVL
ncbi:MAG TPA: pantoate--beta-alanine ligase [Dehalococcoidia bacterium]|nr:pantoate--beta-alanine ligase [Dehalococcoidia bacterium]